MPHALRENWPSTCCFIVNHTTTTEIYTLSLHDALPIFHTPTAISIFVCLSMVQLMAHKNTDRDRKSGSAGMPRPISYAVFCLKKKRSSIALVKGHRRSIIDRGDVSRPLSQHTDDIAIDV